MAWPIAPNSARAAGLRVRTRPCRSSTITPSVSSSITSRLSRVCWCASPRLLRALRSSRAKRCANSLASKLTMNMPAPANPA